MKSQNQEQSYQEIFSLTHKKYTHIGVNKKE